MRTKVFDCRDFVLWALKKYHLFVTNGAPKRSSTQGFQFVQGAGHIPSIFNKNNSPLVFNQLNTRRDRGLRILERQPAPLCGQVRRLLRQLPYP
jgi:hypothetical protein